MKLIIVESPTKARTLSNLLKGGYEIEATMGHIKDLPKSKLGIDVEKKFKPNYVIVEKRNEQITNIVKNAKKAKTVYLATDPDREGEAIAKHVEEIIGSKSKTKRIVFHEITKSAIEEAIENPRSVDKNLVDAQIARRVLDRLVGYKLSPLLWKKVRRGLSAGRVQSVAVRLVVEREREIKDFKPIEYWEIVCEVRRLVNGKEEFYATLVKERGKKIEIGNKKRADKIVSDLKVAKYSISDVLQKEVRKGPFPPFTTSTLTQTASRLFSWSAKRTMAIAQRLYEEGLITYHRTDSTSMSKQAVKVLRRYIKEEYGGKYLPDDARVYKTKSKVAQEAHEAIRPTNIKITKDKINLRKKSFKREGEILYGLIWRRFVQCQMANSIYDETVITVSAVNKDSHKNVFDYLLRTRGQILKFDGWKKLSISKKDKDGDSLLPPVGKGENLDLVKVNPEQKFTQPPARFNEASLIKTLEKLGIGRPSTYAPIITTVQIRKYVEKNEGRFYPTTVGIAVNDFLIGNFPSVFDYEFSAKMEDDLDGVANGKTKWTASIGDFWKPFEKKLGSVEKKAKRVKIEVEKLGKKCPSCKKGDLVIRIGRFGKFVSCSRFPDCDYKEKYLEKAGMKCLQCEKGDVIVKVTKKGRKFFGCSRYPDCDWASWNKPEVTKS